VKKCPKKGFTAISLKKEVAEMLRSKAKEAKMGINKFLPLILEKKLFPRPSKTAHKRVNNVNHKQLPQYNSLFFVTFMQRS